MASFGHTVDMRPDAFQRASMDWAQSGNLGGCMKRGCNQPVSAVVRYNYVTGRAGRVSSAKRGACEAHAAEWARKHSATIITCDNAKGT